TANAAGAVGSTARTHHRLAPCLELGAVFPFWIGTRLRDRVAEFHEKPQILHRARKIPVGFHLIGWLVIVARDKFLMFLHTPVGGPVNVIVAPAVTDRR